MRIYAVAESDGWECRYLAYFSTARKAIKYKWQLQKEEGDEYSYYTVYVIEVDKYENL